MPVTKDQAQMLTSIALACRPTGAPHWDAPGVIAAIGKVAHLHLPDVVRAVTRAAEDATAKTPGVIAATDSIHWAERAPQQIAPRNPTPATACRTCGQSPEQCARRWSGDHEYAAPGAVRAVPMPDNWRASATEENAS